MTKVRRLKENGQMMTLRRHVHVNVPKNQNVRYAVNALVSARTDADQTVNLTVKVQTNEKGGGIIHYVVNLKLVPF